MNQCGFKMLLVEKAEAQNVRPFRPQIKPVPSPGLENKRTKVVFCSTGGIRAWNIVQEPKEGRLDRSGLQKL